MTTIVQRVYRETAVGAIVSLPKSGTQLENRYVFDAAAREVKAMAELGRVKIVDECRESQHDSALITDISFIKMS
jgi:hypothetical protein